MEIVKKIKEKRCVLSLTPIQEDKFGEEKGFKDGYMLPDNNIIELSFEK
jgi:centractin